MLKVREGRNSDLKKNIEENVNRAFATVKRSKEERGLKGDKKVI